ncbi:MAG: rhodanese-like domain-containing protein [Bacteroidales bacterium]
MKDQINFFEQKLEFETDPSDLKSALDAGEKIVVIDARKPEAYEKEHIPGAINLPHRNMNSDSTSGFNKDYLYVTYCDGIGCNASTKGALNMSKLGFRVKELIGGLEWWKKDGYSTEGAKPGTDSKASCGCN